MPTLAPILATVFLLHRMWAWINEAVKEERPKASQDNYKLSLTAFAIIAVVYFIYQFWIPLLVLSLCWELSTWSVYIATGLLNQKK